MQNNNTRIQELFTNWFNGTLSEAEWQELQQLASEETFDKDLPDLLKQQWDTLNVTEDFTLEDRKILGKAITDKYPGAIRETTAAIAPVAAHVHLLRRRWLKYAIAAIIVLLLGSGIYYFNNQSYKPDKSSPITVQTNDIPPGSSKAIWTLPNGKQIELDSTVLDMTIKKEQAAIGYNKLRTPRGGQYQLILPDGSKVWLNAASSIKYPVVFNGKERKVDISGEAYFEIAKDAAKPFKVQSGEQQIEVLGTSFNINAYENEPFKTSLLEGAVKVNQLILKPGQAYLNGKLISTNIEQDIAWKNGVFDFTDTGIQSIMRQLEKWYDIEVRYDGPLPDIQMEGQLNRGVKLSSVLEWLSSLGINSQLNDKTVVLSSKQ